jgi:hypothetical protein
VASKSRTRAQPFFSQALFERFELAPNFSAKFVHLGPEASEFSSQVTELDLHLSEFGL